MNRGTCKSCHAPIVWLVNPSTNRTVPVDARTVNRGDRHYAKTSGHISHYSSCPDAQQHSKNVKRGVAQAAQLQAAAAAPLHEVYDDVDLDAPPPQPYNRRPVKERPPLYVPKDATPEVEALYRRAWELDLDRAEVRIVLACAPYHIRGNPMTWDAATLARAREAIEETARRRDETAALFAANRQLPNFPRR
jgi:hypothetical protein